MISHVSVPDARRNADRARACGQQCRLANAKAASSGENAARPIVVRIGEIDVRVVNDTVANGVIESQYRRARVVFPFCRFLRKGDDLRRVAVDEDARGKELSHLHRVVLLRAGQGSHI